MDNNEIEVLDDFELEEQNINEQQPTTVDTPNIDIQSDTSNTSSEQSTIVEDQVIDNQQSVVLENQNAELKNEATPVEPVTSEEKKEIENPVVEMINNKTTMRLIAIMLVILFIAVFLMPKVFELIGTV